MLDIQFIRESPELVQKKSFEKGYKNVDVDAQAQDYYHRFYRTDWQANAHQ